ncbi:MAG: hypothetical protein IRY97_06595 [Thermomicrobiaceae bacterium]|nr:hypothetical protein [Thermomicrobiaceae bacterium]
MSFGRLTTLRLQRAQREQAFRLLDEVEAWVRDQPGCRYVTSFIDEEAREIDVFSEWTSGFEAELAAVLLAEVTAGAPGELLLERPITRACAGFDLER